jgi:hypothetical protein
MRDMHASDEDWPKTKQHNLGDDHENHPISYRRLIGPDRRRGICKRRRLPQRALGRSRVFGRPRVVVDLRCATQWQLATVSRCVCALGEAVSVSRRCASYSNGFLSAKGCTRLKYTPPVPVDNPAAAVEQATRGCDRVALAEHNLRPQIPAYHS